MEKQIKYEDAIKGLDYIAKAWDRTGREFLWALIFTVFGFGLLIVVAALVQ
jgi:hypothetical protein